MEVIVKVVNDKVSGVDVVIESPKDSMRHGKDWIQRMAHDYGYIEDTIGADGDEMDCFIGSSPESKCMFVIEQIKANGDFDEHKIMIGFNNIAEAKDAYHANYPEGWEGFKHICEIETKDFWEWYEGLNKKENTMSEPYKFGNTNAVELIDRGKHTYGSKVDNSVCECPVCFGGKTMGLFACKNCKGTGVVENENRYQIKEEHDGSYTVNYADGSASKRKDGFETREEAQKWADTKFNSDGTEVLEEGEEIQEEGKDKIEAKGKKKTGPFYENAESCATCDGTGKLSGGKICKDCEGTGYEMSS